jgi:hypothetical protein
MAPPRLARAREDVEQFIERQIERGREVLQDAADVNVSHDEESYKRWAHEPERWDALTAEGLRAMYLDEEASDEFQHAATGASFA